jgi:hypothetical protein
VVAREMAHEIRGGEHQSTAQLLHPGDGTEGV